MAPVEGDVIALGLVLCHGSFMAAKRKLYVACRKMDLRLGPAEARAGPQLDCPSDVDCLEHLRVVGRVWMVLRRLLL